MSEAPPRASAGPSAGWDSSETLPVAEARELFVTLGKALRAVQLYDANNPVYQRFVDSLRSAFRRLWEGTERLVVAVEEERIVLEGEEVYRSDSRADSLAFLFFKDGIRELAFLPGIEEGELEQFLGVLQKARRVRGEGDDLLTLLWEADLRTLRHRFVDVLAEAVEIPEPGPGAPARALEEVRQEVAGGAAATGQPPPQAISRDDFNPTLYSLDAREMETLRQEMTKEMERDLRGNVLAALFDRLEEPRLPERQAEILAILRVLLPSFLSRGALASTAEVLRELRALEARDEVLDEGGRRKLTMVVDELSSPATVDELVRALEDGSISPSAAELGELLNHFRPAALGPLLRASELTEERELQKVLREAVQGIAHRNRAALPHLLEHDDPVVVAGAARLAGRMEITEAGPSLAGLMTHPDRDVRLAAVEAATTLRASTAAGALERVLGDPDREVRIAAARALGALRYRPAARAFRDVVTGKDIRGADLTEKIAFFESYGELGDEGAVELLDRLLNGRGFLGRKESAEIRACAALALGKIEGPAARQALQAAASEEDPVVRNAVGRALRGERPA